MISGNKDNGYIHYLYILIFTLRLYNGSFRYTNKYNPGLIIVNKTCNQIHNPGLIFINKTYNQIHRKYSNKHFCNHEVFPEKKHEVYKRSSNLWYAAYTFLI